MNELPTSPESPSAAQAESFQSAPSRPSQSSYTSRQAHDGERRSDMSYEANKLLYTGLTVVAVLLAAQWWVSHAEFSSLRTEVARRLQSGDVSNTEAKLQVKTVQDTARELQGKVSVLESKQAEAQSQQLALEALYQELSKNRDDWALAEIEQVLSTASQQLQLAGNVQGALIALQNADARLSRSDKPQFITIRRAIAKDQDKLKSLPSVDVTGIALRLDSIIGQIDGMPLLSDEKPLTVITQPRNSRRDYANANVNAAGVDVSRASSKVSVASDWIASVDEKWQSLISEMWGEVRQLVRVRTVETSDALLLSPTQAYYARENLKLRLLNARLALLSRNESAFRSDLIASQDAITKYFDTRAKQTQVTQALLKQVQGSNLAIEMPSLADSLNAVRNYKIKP